MTLKRLIFRSLERTYSYDLQNNYEENNYMHNLDFANSSHTNRVFQTLREVGAWLKVSIEGPITFVCGPTTKAGFEVFRIF